jgi:hypothetical protein
LRSDVVTDGNANSGQQRPWKCNARTRHAAVDAPARAARGAWTTRPRRAPRRARELALPEGASRWYAARHDRTPPARAPARQAPPGACGRRVARAAP